MRILSRSTLRDFWECMELRPIRTDCQLVDGEYQIKLFRGNERVESAVFPELNLTAQQVFNGG